MAGTIYSAELPASGQRRIEGFNPASDKLDLGSNSVHGYIVVDTGEGVAFMDPWSGRQTLIVGISLGQLTVNSFVPVENDHLRQDLSGALAWEHGITQKPNTVYARSHEVGQIDRVAFNADTDVVDFRYYGTREQLYMVDGAEGVVIGNYTTGQTLILLGTTVADLSADNFLFHSAQVREDRIFLQLGLASVPDSQVISRADIPTVGTNVWPTTAGPGAPPSGVTGTTYLIDWDYGSKTVLDFDPATDKLDFKYFRPAEFTVAEVNGSTVITIVGQNQTYTLTGVSLAELDYNNIVAVEDATYQKWRGLIEAADAGGTLPTLRVADAQLSEGQSGTSLMSFTVTLSKAAAGVVSVDYSTLNGTALAGSDYQAAIGRLTFQPGETSKTVQVTINGDAIFELNEAFDLVLSSPSGATLADERATGTIVNDDAQAPNVLPAVSIADLSVTEGDGAHVHFMFLVTLDKASTSPVTVQYRTANGTALAGSDYEATSGTVTFAAGETAKQIHVDVIGDKVAEADERFTVELSAPTGATIADGSATGTLLNDDGLTPTPVPALSVADLSVSEGNGDHVHFMFMVTLDKPSTTPVTVQYRTVNGTAVAGTDYEATNGTLTFAPGETSKQVHVDIIGDKIVEADERFTVELSGPTDATIADGTATGTLLNDDAAAPPAGGNSLAFAVTDNWGAGFTGAMTLKPVAALNGWTVEFDASFDISNIWNAEIVSHVGDHYVIRNAAWNGKVAANGEVSFGFQASPGGTAIVADDFVINGTPAGGGTDPVPVLPTLAISDASVAEGNDGTSYLSFTVTLSKAAASAVSVAYASANGTATAGQDYQAVSGTLTFAAGETSKVIRVPVIGDKVVEANEALSIALSKPSGATLADASGTGTITNDDVAPTLPTLAIGDASVAEGNDGTAYLSFTVTLSKAAAGAVSVAYASANGTATAGQDYQAVSGTLTFAAGETSKVIRVPVIGDKVVEANEALSITLSKPSGATLADASGTGTITNDDVAPTLPTLAISDASVAEGNDGTAYLSFTVTLSKAAASAVSVAYASANGTATAGQDYQAVSGTLTFAAGETSKVIRVPVIGDKVVEANEALTITLSKPSGATLADASGTGTITNDDVTPPPTVSVAGTTVVEGDAGAGGGAADGWFSTFGNQIVDSDGNPVKLAGVNWFGFESSNASPHGVWTRSYTDMMDQMKELDFNTIRLPFASATLHATSASGIDYSQNPDLRGLTPLQIMDKIVAYAEEIGLKVILDHHRSSFGAGTSENGLWYDSTYTEAAWIDDWQMLAERYADNTAVIGADLHNEPYNGTWGGGGARDWAAAAERAGNAIGEVNPNWLIIVEGVGSYEGANYWWGGNLKGVADRPIELDVPNKLVYSAHDYGNSVYEQPWFKDPNFAAQLPAKFDEMWGYIYRENIAPVLIGEFGTKLTDPKDAPWLEALTSYMAGDFDNDGTIDIPAGQEGISWTYWSWNPNSGDTGGILADDWRTVNTNKMAYLEPIQFDLEEGGSSGAGTYAVFTITLSAAATQAVTVNYQTVAGTAGADDFTAASGTLNFAAGETTKTVRIAITGDNLAEATESFTLLLSNAQGAVIGVAQASAVIQDDDAAAPTLPTLSVSDATALEGSASAAGMLTFTVTLSEAATGPVSVKYATANGSAVAGQDYQAASGTLTFAAGETSKTIKVAAIGDGVLEGNETFNLVLSSPTGATLADGTGRGTIENDDAAPPAGGDAVSFTVASNWGTGFTAAMTLKPEATLNGWTVEFDAPFDISNIWNAQIVSHVGDHYVVRNASWNGKVAAGGEVSFGFQASGGSATADDFIVNGRAVGGEEASALRTASVSLSNDVIDASIALVESRAADFTAEVTLHNEGAALSGWTLEIDTPYEIAQLQGAEIVSRDEDGYVVRNLAATAALDHGADVRFQLVGHGTFDSSQFDFLI
ncbi:Calx-beta domain-containing protein [Ancylobacter sp. WKF20]|uniref:Calx-beta domain-containing protein n=1 Tax=Ancylobacter sp. WKF20 TaxID=3039801 RepID=UPI00243419FD|nr:Calx-beta domain-containing protein [Ancylobacter sp. WKF20]WGD31100.1 Calx-beta domain-containing protein [Ancylobacter sp. WKF20]